MSDLRKAAQDVIDRWHSPKWAHDSVHTGVLIDRLRAALAAPEQEPVAWTVGGLITDFSRDFSAYETKTYTVPLYRHPAHQAAQPVAWQVMVENEPMKEFPIKDMAHDWAVTERLNGSPHSYWIRPLFTAPLSREWQSLTDGDVDRILRTQIPGGSAAADWFLPHDSERGLQNVRSVVRLMIDAALRTKNTGEQA